MKIAGIKCKKCNSIIYSRARHDFRRCPCDTCAVDGGFNYLKVSGDITNWKRVEIELDITKSELFQDWNYGHDKYGLIKGEKNE